jgi:excisionase family DNA binding protein
MDSGGRSGKVETLALTPRETATELRISRSKVYELLAAGVLPSVRIGASIRIPRDALREWIARQLEARQS